MKRMFKLLIPAIVAVALFASCEDQMDEMVVKDAAVEAAAKSAVMMPDKPLIKVPPR